MATINLVTLTTKELQDALKLWLEANGMPECEQMVVVSHGSTVFCMQMEEKGFVRFDKNGTQHRVGDA